MALRVAACIRDLNSLESVPIEKYESWLLMAKEKQLRPRLIAILTVLLILQAPLLVFLGLNLITDRWAFLTSWDRFWAELQAAFVLVSQTPGTAARDELLVYDVISFAILAVSAGLALVAGVTFLRGKAINWILGLMAQIGTLASGLSLYFIHQPPQAYWLLAVGIIMVLYLNYGEVRQWFLQQEETEAEVDYV